MANINEIIPKSVISSIIDLDKKISKVDDAMLKFIQTNEKLLAAYKKGELSLKQLSTAMNAAEKETKELSDIQKKLEGIEKGVKTNTDEVVKARIKASVETKEQKERITELVQAEKGELGTLQKLQNENKKLAKERKTLNLETEKGRKRLKDINAQLNKNNATIKKNSDALSKQKMNVGNYTGSIKDALSQLGIMPPVLMQATGAATALGKGMKGATAATTMTSKAMKILKVALISTGIGAIVVALGSLIAYLSDTASGTGKLAKAMAPLKAILSTITSLAKKFGEALALFADGEWDEGFKLLKEGVKGAGDEYKRHAAIQKTIAEAEEVLHQKRKQSILDIQLQQTEERRLRALSKDEKESLEDRIAAQKKAIAIAKNVAETRQDIAAIELAILAQKSQLSEDSREEEIALEEARASHNAIMEDYNKQLATMITYLGGLEKKLGKVKDVSISFDEALQGMASATTDYMLSEFDIRAEAEIAASEYTNDRLAQMDEAEREREIELNQIKIEEAKTLQEKRIAIAQQSISAISAIGDQFFEFQSQQLSQQTAQYAEAKAFELKMAGDNQEEINKINEKYAKKEAELKTKQAKQDKTAAIFRTIINIAQGIVAMFQAGPAGIVLGALTAAIGAASLATIIAQPLPKFAKGTQSAPSGLVEVGERGRELVETKSGKLLMANGPTITSGLEGARIYSNPETERILKGRKDIGYDSNDLREVVESNNRIERAIRNKRELHVHPTKPEITERKGSYYKKYFNTKLGI